MRAIRYAFAALLLSGAPLSADALAEGEALVKKSGCMACHQVSRKVVGPAYLDVAKKYKGQAGAAETLVQKVKKGGSGVWGPVPMTPHPQIPDADIRKMVDWILAGAPSSVPAPAPKAAAPTPAPAAPAKPEQGKDGKPQRQKKAHSHLAPKPHGGPKLSWATDEQKHALLAGQGCLGCHSGLNALGEAAPKPWPSFKQIAARRGADLGAQVAKVRSNQGPNRWGNVPHPPYEHLPAEAVQALVQHVMAGKADQAPAAVDLSAMGAEEWMKTRSDCFTCHQVNRKATGPAFVEIARRYTEKDVPALVKKVKEGGSGNWGSVPMTAHPTAPDAMVEKAVRWILERK